MGEGCDRRCGARRRDGGTVLADALLSGPPRMPANSSVSSRDVVVARDRGETMQRHVSVLNDSKVLSPRSAGSAGRPLLKLSCLLLVVCALALALPGLAAATPALSSPTDGAEVPAATQVFSWTDDYAQGPIDHWYMEISTSPSIDYYPFGFFSGDLAYASGRLTSTSVNLNAIGRALPPGIYYWHVVGYYGPFGSAGTAWSTVRSFTVQASGAVAPTIAVSPASLTFTVEQGDSNIYEQLLDISNSGGGTLQFSALVPAPVPPWLQIDTGASTGYVYSMPVRVYVGTLAPGEYSGKVRVQDNGSSPAATNSPVDVPITLKVVSAGTLDAPEDVPIAGATRYETAIEASKRAYPYGASTVVIATGANWPDALGGAALAGMVNGPLLLTTTNALPAAVLDEVKRLGATDAYILGGTGAVATAVENTLKANVSGNVTRLAGANRYGTANAVADEVIRLMGTAFHGDAFIATGANFPDALGASPIAAAAQAPILLAPTNGVPYLPDQVSYAVILGGTGAVSSSTEAAVRAELGASNVARVGGVDRYDTAAQVADFGVDIGMRWDGVGIATGAAFPDALSGGAMLGSFESVLLLTRPDALVPVAEQRLAANKADIGTVHFIGGTGAVSQAVRDKVSQVLQ